MTPQTFTLSSLVKKGEAAQAVFQAPEGMVCTIEPPRRTLSQNALIYKWYAEAARDKVEPSPIDARRHCKLHFGVPILRGGNADFCEKYDRTIKHLPYETKLGLMDIVPVTSLMNVKQESQYLDEVFRHYTSKGARLTIPEDRQ